MIQRVPVATFAFVGTLFVSTACVGQELVYRLDPELGTTYAGTTTTETRTRTQMQGMDIEVSMTMRMDHDVVFEAGSDDTVVGRYKTTSVSAEMGGMPGLDQAPFDLNDLYQGMVGVTFTMVMTRGGELVEFDGLEAMMEAMLDRLEAPDELRVMMGQFLEGNFGEDQIKQMTGQSGLSLPDRPVAVGDTWTDSVSALGIDIETTYTLTNRSDGLASIDATATVSGAEDAGFEFPGLPSMPGLEMRYENLSGSIAGSYELDESTGLTSAYSMNMTMDTDMVMEMPQVEGQPAGASSMSISTSMETSVEGTLGKAE
ncbi:MAG: hypothetical protein F4060_04940 [Holophagales bacterium]|nr:hypothetical protein [Holophagales bacterium]MYG29852.1 hypothetical protein [Holophagales bacterium]MYI79266.1 hypothetical protein [Holophagales bacterium]